MPGSLTVLPEMPKAFSGIVANASIDDGFSIFNAKCLSLLQWHSIAGPASDIIKYFI